MLLEIVLFAIGDTHPGIVIFTILIGLDQSKGLGNYLAGVFSKVPFEELGIRLSGIFGFILCFTAAIIFSFFNEKKLKASIDAMEAELAEKSQATTQDSGKEN